MHWMNLNKQTDISLRVLMHLALNPDELSTISEIADAHNISRNHLMKVVHQLAKLGYVKSVQGRGGGIRLGCPASTINVGKVVRATETTLNIVDCVAFDCLFTNKCTLKTALNQATDAFMSVLDDYTIADLTKNRRQLLKLIS